jgi:hypothetical protein
MSWRRRRAAGIWGSSARAAPATRARDGRARHDFVRIFRTDEATGDRESEIDPKVL